MRNGTHFSEAFSSVSKLLSTAICSRLSVQNFIPIGQVYVVESIKGKKVPVLKSDVRG